MALIGFPTLWVLLVYCRPLINYEDFRSQKAAALQTGRWSDRNTDGQTSSRKPSPERVLPPHTGTWEFPFPKMRDPNQSSSKKDPLTSSNSRYFQDVRVSGDPNFKSYLPHPRERSLQQSLKP